MAFAPLILKGNLEINGTDVSAQVTSFTIKGKRDEVRIPATFGSRSTVAGGDDQYEVEIAYLQDVDATAISEIFWAALADSAGTVTFSGTMRTGAISATNPAYEGTALVTGVGKGGGVNTVGVDTQTFPLTDRPTKATS